MTHYDRWLEKDYQEQAAHDEALEEMIDEIIMTEPQFHPFNIKTFFDAIDDACLYKGKKEFEKILHKKRFSEKDFYELGILLFNFVYLHCYNQASQEALKRFNEGLEGQERH